MEELEDSCNVKRAEKIVAKKPWKNRFQAKGNKIMHPQKIIVYTVAVGHRRDIYSKSDRRLIKA